MKLVYEFLIPTRYGDNHAIPIKTRHHKKWDERVQKITGGLTILSPAKGKWTYKGVEYPEKIIPVRIICDNPEQMQEILKFTLTHYRQKTVVCYLISQEVHMLSNDAI